MSTQSRSETPDPAHAHVDIHWNRSVKMRNGIGLNVIVYLPKDRTGPLPTVCEATPYGVDRLYKDGIRFANAGIAFVAADVRGRGDSQGSFRMWESEPADIRDLLDWCCEQDWCNGKIGLYGSSYTGTNQWMALKDRSPALRTIIPAGTAMNGVDMPWGGVPNAHGIIWGVLTSGKPPYWNHFASPHFWSRYLAELRTEKRSFSSIPGDFGIDHPDFLLQVEKPQWGPHWERLLPSQDDLQAIDFPILCVTGQNDSASVGTLHAWDRFHNLAPEQAEEFGHILIGPWGHGGMEGSQNLGELRFSKNANADFQKLKIEWYHWLLGDGSRPDFIERKVTYYICGEESWHNADSLPAASDQKLVRYLDQAGTDASSAYRSGRLQEMPADIETATFQVGRDEEWSEVLEFTQRPDEAGPGAAYGALFPPPNHNLFNSLWSEDPTDPIFSLDQNGFGVVYHSEPLSDTITLAGKPALNLSLSADVVDADICVLLHEVKPDGSTILLTSTMQRLSWVDAPQHTPLTPGETRQIELKNFRWVARSLAERSRIRLTIRAVTGLYFEPNADCRQADGKHRGNISLYVGGEAGCQLVLPLAAKTDQVDPGALARS
ncbi:MAG: CocE/NonD family hydrolase [Pseudomonadota bacterium]